MGTGGTPFRPLTDPETRPPYDFWYQGPDGTREPLREPQNDLRPVLFKVEPKPSNQGASRLDREDVALLAGDLLDLSDVVLLPHDLAHCLVMLEQFAASELVLFLERDASLPDLTARITALFDRLSCDVTLVRSSGGAIAGLTNPVSADTLVGDVVDLLMAAEQRNTPPPQGAPLVVTALVDHAIAFANARFCAADRTRVAAYWAQCTSATPRGGTLGCMLSEAEINGLLVGLKNGIFRDEDSMYRALGLSNGHAQGRMLSFPLGLSFGHGTQVLDVAAGEDPLSGSEFSYSDHRILAVQLPKELVAQTNGYMTDLWVISALNWIWAQSVLLRDKTGRRVEVLFNYSFALHGGRHDGRELIETELELRLERGEFCLATQPAGNSFLSRTFAQATPQDIQDGQAAMDLVVQPDDAAPTFVFLTLPEGVDPGEGDYPLCIDLEAPNGARSSGMAGRDGVYESLVDAGARAEIYYRTDRPRQVMPRSAPATARATITIAINPTTTRFYDNVLPSAPGRWRLSLRGMEGQPEDAVVYMWVERGDTPRGFPERGRQAYFDHPDYVRFAPDGRPEEHDAPGSGPVRRFGTLSGIATAETPLATGSMRQSDMQMSWFSSGRAEHMPDQPSLSAVSERSYARPYILTSGTMSGSITPSTGTSFACAEVARRGALALLNGECPAGQLRQYLLDQAENPQGLDSRRVGAGYL